jgi:hypothetical protein
MKKAATGRVAAMLQLGIKRKFATPIIYQLLYQVLCKKSRKEARNKRF